MFPYSLLCVSICHRMFVDFGFIADTWLRAIFYGNKGRLLFGIAAAVGGAVDSHSLSISS